MAALVEEKFWGDGPKPGCFYNFPGPSSIAGGAAKHTLHPTTTGTSVLGVQFEGGVMIAADMLGSYGSLARYRNVSRVYKVNDSTILGAGGDYADFQHIRSIIEQQVIDEECLNDGFNYTPKALHSWLTRVLYNRRCRFDPLWNTYVVAGLQDGQPYLGYVDKIGMAYEAPSVCTGFGAYMAQPMIRDALEKADGKLSEADARQLLDRCLKVLFYRDARSFNKYEIAVVTEDGARVEGPLSSQTNWSIANMVKGYE